MNDIQALYTTFNSRIISGMNLIKIRFILPVIENRTEIRQSHKKLSQREKKKNTFA